MNPDNFMGMTRLDHNRAIGRLTQKLEVKIGDISKFVLWGNHSPTMYPDISYATLSDGRKLSDLLDRAWENDHFYPFVKQRGKQIIDYTGKSSAASAAHAAIMHMKDWVNGTYGQWQSMSTISDGSYGIDKGIVYSFPTIIDEKGKPHMVKDLPISWHSRKMLDFSLEELKQERDAVSHLLN